MKLLIIALMAIGQCIVCNNPAASTMDKAAAIRKSLINTNSSNRRIMRRREAHREADFNKELVFKFHHLLL